MKSKKQNPINAAERRRTRQTPKTIQKQAEVEKKKSKWTQQPKNPFIRKGPQINPADIIVDTQLNKIKVEGEEHSELTNTTKQERASPLPFETQDLEDDFPSVKGTLVAYSLPPEITTRPEEASDNDNANSEMEEVAVNITENFSIYLQSEHCVPNQRDGQRLGFPPREEDETTNDFKTEIEKLQQMLKQKDDENALLVDEIKRLKDDLLVALAAPGSPGTSDLSAVNRRLWNLIGGKCAEENVELNEKNLEQQKEIHNLQKTVSLQTQIMDRLTSSNSNLTNEIASKNKMIEETQERLNELKDENEHQRSDISNLTLQLQTAEENKLSLERQLKAASAKVNELEIKSLEEELERIFSERKLENFCISPTDSLDSVNVDVDPNFAEDIGFSSSVREMPVSPDHGVRIEATTSSTENNEDRMSPDASQPGKISVVATSTKRSLHSQPENCPLSRTAKRQKTDQLPEIFNLRDRYGNNLMFQAVREEEDLNELKFLAELGFYVRGQNVCGESILHLAVKCHKDPEVIRFLIAVGADVNLKNNLGDLPIHQLANVKQKFREKLMALCENGADINAKDGNGNTILHLAAYKRGEMEDIEYIVKKGGDWKLKNQDGQTVVHKAAAGGHPEVINYLIRIGMNVHEKDNDGSMPVHLACFAEQNFKETMNALSAHGAAINSTDKDGDTVLALAALNSSRSKEDIKYIVSKCSDVSRRHSILIKYVLNIQRQTVLHNAAVGGNPEVIKLLIDLGADVSYEDDSGATPLLLIASTKGDFKGSLDAFLDSGANINEQDDEGNTLLTRSVVSHARTRADLEYIVRRSRS